MRWGRDGPIEIDEDQFPIVYEDRDLALIVDTLLALIVVAGESRKLQSCAHIVSAIEDPHPGPINVHPVFPEPIVTDVGTPSANAIAFEVTINNQCVDEVGAGPKGAVAVAMTSFDTATGAERGGIRGLPGSVRALGFAPDGKRLIVGLTDTTALIFDVPRRP